MMSTPLACAAFAVNGAAVSEQAFQAHALNTSQNVVIEACAGSGKTWLLTARLLRLLLAGTQPQAILAITFTRKATQEMKQRLAQLLDMLCQLEHTERAHTLLALGLQDTPALRASLAQCWQQAFTAGEWPTIATFHEWFASVRKAAPFSLQSAPAAVLTEDEHAHIQRAWQAFWKNSQHDVVMASHMKVAIAQLGLNGFETAMKAVFTRRAEWQVYSQNLTVAQAQAAFEGFLAVKPIAQIAREVLPLAQQIQAFPKLYLAIDGKEMNKRGQSIAAALVQFDAYHTQYASDIDQADVEQTPVFQALASTVKTMLASLSNANFALPAASRIVFAPMKSAVVEAAGSVEGFIESYTQIHTALIACHEALDTLRLLPAHHGVLHCANALIQAYQHDKLAHGVVDFTDLELEALSVLQATQSESGASDLPWTRTQHVLLDEFQDTNPIQWQALQAFLTPLLQESKAGGQAASVFMVGDPKQSIYRFRRADPALFGHVAQWLHAQFGAVLLRTQRTRRSAQAVNALVNAVFVNPELADPIFSQQFTLSAQTGQVLALPVIVKTEAGAGAGADSGDVAQAAPIRSDLLRQAMDDTFGAAHPFAGEAEQIATQLLAWKALHAHVPWAQVMVLSRRRAPLQAVAKALHAQNIPCISDEKGGFFQQSEVADVVALLTALHNPLDVLATLQALRSPIFGLTNAQLSALLNHWQQAKTQGAAAWCGLASLDAAWARNAVAWLKQWHWQARHLPTHDALDAMVYQGNIQARMVAASPPSRALWIAAYLQQLLRTALDVDGGRYPSLAKFIAHVQALAASDTLAAEPLAAPDAVRLSTIHGAKGLEAELVILMDACSATQADDPIHAMLDWPATQAQPSYFGVVLGASWAGDAAHLAAAKSAAASALEQHTLLYVALTRAKTALWVSGTEKHKKITVYGKVASALALQALSHDEPLSERSPAMNTAQATQAPAHRPIQPALHSVPPQQRAPMPVSLLLTPPLISLTAKPYIEPLTTQRGKALHSALQTYMQHGSLPSPAALLLRSTLPLADIHAALQDASVMIATLQLAALRKHRCVHRIAIEQAWLTPQAQVLRPDLVVYGQAVQHMDEHAPESAAENASEHGLCWLIDYKSHFKPSHAAALEYAQQLQAYLDVLPLGAQGYLLTSDGECWQFLPAANTACMWAQVTVPWG